MAYADGNIVVGTTVDMYGMNTGLRKIKNSIRELAYFTGATLGIAGLVKFGKAALDAASDVQEVQNVVDVAFGDMAWTVDKFAETCIEKFGMSELAAKQTAGSFMAMGKALGLSQKNAANMALRLTALSGDFASFYNISQDYARVALSAIYTGETETLKRYGIVLTEANLQEFALKKGIDASVKSMDSATKTMLRYQYVLENGNLITGDFERTSNSWANQLRVLKERWTQLLITIGNGLKQIFTPALQMLNKLVSSTIQATKALGDLIAKVFGITWEKETSDAVSGISNSAGDAADSLNDLGDAVEKTGKKIKQTISPYDELNNVVTKTDDSASDANDLFGDIADFMGDLGNEVEGATKQFPDFESFFDFGKWLGEGLKNALDNIPWDEIQDTAYKIGKALADTINGFISVEGLGYTIGKTLGEAINTGIIGINAFLDNTQWFKLGEFIGDGINGMIDTIRWEELGHLFAAYFNALFDMVGGASLTINFAKLGTRFGDGINQMINDINWDKYGLYFGSAINGIVQSVNTMTLTVHWETLSNNIKSALNTLFTTIDTNALGHAFANTINSIFVITSTFLKTDDAGILGRTIGNTLETALDNIQYENLGYTIIRLINDALTIVSDFFTNFHASTLTEGLGTVINTAISEIDGELLGNTINTIILNLINGINDFILTIDWVMLGTNIQNGIMNAINAINREEIIMTLNDTLKNIIDAVSTFIETVDWYELGYGIESWIINAVLSIDWLGITEKLIELLLACVGGILSIQNGISDAIAEVMRTILYSAIESIYDWFVDLGVITYNSMIEAINENASGNIYAIMLDFGRNILLRLLEGMGEICSTIVNWCDEHIGQPMREGLDNTFDVNQSGSVLNGVVNAFEYEFWRILLDTVQQYVPEFTNYFSELTNEIVRIFDDFGYNAVSAWENMWYGIRNVINEMLDGVETFANGGIDAVNGLVDALNSFSIDVPDWVTDISGIESFGGFDLPYANNISIPRLASGAVIPPNAPFMAMLGDQTSGTNIEAPLDTIVSAMVQALNESGIGGSSNQDIVIQVDGYEIARATRKQDQIFKQSTGHSMFSY